MRYPKPCLGGWGRRSLDVSPSGKVLPCHAADTIPGLEFWSVRDHSIVEIWQSSPAVPNTAATLGCFFLSAFWAIFRGH
jgi:MoaA/NifB/PqqE/SkfB family radical SAM enzyme